MTKQKPVRDFIEYAIKSLSKEEFDEVVRIFQLHYLNCEEVVNVDGVNDAGCDVRIYKNKREYKKCIQVTVNKSIETKLLGDLKKIDVFITKYMYSEKVEFFCTVAISNEKIEEYKETARRDYNIDLDMYEAKRLSQIDCKELCDYIYGLHKDVVLKPEDIKVDKSTKAIYDLLAKGKDTTDIKNGLLNSIIISVLYENGSMDSAFLKTEVEKRLGKNLPDIIQAVNSLKSERRIVKDSNNNTLLKLSESEFENVRDIFAYAAQIEKDFIDALNVIQKKHAIENNGKLLSELKETYKSFYSKDIDINTNNRKANDRNRDTFEYSLKKKIIRILPNKNDVDGVIYEIMDLCSKNSYLNRVCVSESFLSLYKSNKLEKYITQKQKDIYLDTPAFVYLLCSTFDVGNQNDWDDPLYRSMKSLAKLQQQNSEKVHFYIMQDYLDEVAGELRKGIQIANLEDCPFFEDLGKTRNSFYNHYRYLKDNKLFEIYQNIDSFADYLDLWNLSSELFADKYDNLPIVRELKDIAEDYGLEVCYKVFDDFEKHKMKYERQLTNNKSMTAINHDVTQILYLLESDNNAEHFLTTWDSTLVRFRDSLMKEDLNRKFNYFCVYNPAKLSNKIALENFNIDESALTNDIFAYADKSYDISGKIKNLIDLIAPIFENKDTRNQKLLKQLGEIRKSQVDNFQGFDVADSEKKNLPIEEVVEKMIPSKELVSKDPDVILKFQLFMNSESNNDYIVNLIKKESKNILDNKVVDMSDFFKRVTEVSLEKNN